MQISYKHQAVEKRNSDVCAVIEHAIEDSHLDMAIVTITGRYPEANFAANLKSKEIVYVSEGTGKVVINDQQHLLNAGDVVLIEPGEKFYWEGNMKLVASCSPAWSKEQHVLIA